MSTCKICGSEIIGRVDRQWCSGVCQRKLAKIEQERTGKEVHVDHIVPLNSSLVCGLHCEDNMQLLFAEDNIRKGNHYSLEHEGRK